MYLKDIVGQETIIMQAKAIVEKLASWNILIRGKYGSGKTAIALCLAALCGNFTYQIPIAGKVTVNNLATVNIVDECHLLRTVEILYPLMDNGDFIFCTNVTSKLPEAFISRCFEFSLGEYTTEELTRIVMFHSGNRLPRDVAQFIARRCKFTPRLGVMLLNKYLALCEYRHVPVNLETATRIFQELGIDDCGFDSIDRKYLDLVQVPKSKNTLMAALSLDSGELERREQFLIHQSLVEITSRGRIYNGI